MTRFEIIYDQSRSQIAVLDHETRVPIEGASIFYGESSRPSVILTCTSLALLPLVLERAGLGLCSVREGKRR